jgi:hypothetical protein
MFQWEHAIATGPSDVTGGPVRSNPRYCDGASPFVAGRFYRRPSPDESWDQRLRPDPTQVGLRPRVGVQEQVVTAMVSP